MIYSESYHDTWEQAEKEGIEFVVSWGRAYSPNYRVYQSQAGSWVCVCTRWRNCD